MTVYAKKSSWILRIQILFFFAARRTPFILGVHFDGFEAAAANGVAQANMNEAADGAGANAYAMGPLGTIGFSLTYTMRPC